MAALLDIPFCVAGGIRAVADAEEILNKGADKVSINSPALQQPKLIYDLAKRFGSQCVVVGIDSMESSGDYVVHQLTGDSSKSHASRWRTGDWMKHVQELGAGEIVLNCMNQDGVRNGYDIPQLQQARSICQVPLIASGGAGRQEHFLQVFRDAGVDGALAASVFHSGEISVADLKQFLGSSGIHVRT